MNDDRQVESSRHSYLGRERPFLQYKARPVAEEINTDFPNRDRTRCFRELSKLIDQFGRIQLALGRMESKCERYLWEPIRESDRGRPAFRRVTDVYDAGY